METTISEIQVEQREEKPSAEASAQDGRPEDRAAVLCFKRRKKTAKGPKGPAPSGASDQRQPLRGAWASFQRLVAPRKRAAPSKPPKPVKATSQSGTKAEAAGPSKKKATSRLKIPCIKFSSGQRRSPSEAAGEDAAGSLGGQPEAEHLPPSAQAPWTAGTPGPRPTPEPREGVPPKDGDEPAEARVGHAGAASGKKMVSVELGLESEHPTIPPETPHLESDPEASQETPGGGPEPASPKEASDTQRPLPGPAEPPPAAASPEQPAGAGARAGGAPREGPGRGAVAAEEGEPEGAPASTGGPAREENEVEQEQRRSEESKRMEPIAIIITDTEISEFDVTKSKNVPKQFLISIEREPVGVFANDGGYEGRTSEQYEALLVETAASLVDNAIQLSIEQLVNEMVSDDSKINNLLQ
ncbi:A-kinase anchor protein 5 [Echinops telfairi]|uniref:A-kinase anchor protein 5 n=1 Tax=Echinops telfairi TaxID=9371 RepID=A0ABM0IFS4_ECHTE|nr:A-kinase anchor protein 5 [Echinops telfairi]